MDIYNDIYNDIYYNIYNFLYKILYFYIKKIDLIIINNNLL